MTFYLNLTMINEVTCTLKHVCKLINLLKILQFDAGKLKERISRLPFLMATSNSSVIDLTLRNLSTVSNHSRFGCEMMFVNSYTQKPSKLEQFRSIDDEYCPAVFTMVNVDLYGEGKN